MSKKDKIVAVVLGLVTAMSSAITAYEVRQIAKNGFEIELSVNEAQQIVDAFEAAQTDIEQDITE